MTRDKITRLQVDRATLLVMQHTEARLKEKGDGAYAGPHECYGIIAEEFKELLDAVQANDSMAECEELIDIAVACIIGLASGMPADTSTRSGEDGGS